MQRLPQMPAPCFGARARRSGYGVSTRGQGGARARCCALLTRCGGGQIDAPATPPGGSARLGANGDDEHVPDESLFAPESVSYVSSKVGSPTARRPCGCEREKAGGGVWGKGGRARGRAMGRCGRQHACNHTVRRRAAPRAPQQLHLLMRALRVYLSRGGWAQPFSYIPGLEDVELSVPVPKGGSVESSLPACPPAYLQPLPLLLLHLLLHLLLLLLQQQQHAVAALAQCCAPQPACPEEVAWRQASAPAGPQTRGMLAVSAAGRV